MKFSQIEDYAVKHFGMVLSAYKEEQLNRRIASFISRVGARDEHDFILRLNKDRELKQKFQDFLTINVSEFFRNKDIFLELKEVLKKEKHACEFKIWSAACSYGCEPYTIAIIMDEICPRGTYKITATDIDGTILARAREGLFTESDVKNVDRHLLDRYFTKTKEGYAINSEIKNKVQFKKHDLIAEEYEKNFDLIVCRNVLIYFKEDAKKDIYKKFSNSLVKNGLLFVGATESLYNYKEYDYEKVSTFIYRKI